MSFSTIAFIKAIILPPTINFLLVIVGLCLLKKHQLFSKILIMVASLSLMLFCLAPFSNMLLKSLEKYPALEPPVKINDEQAIVVLAGGSHPNAKEYGREIDGSATLQRNHYASFLYKQLNLPILVTGGLFEPKQSSEATVMANTLLNSFGVPVAWQENRSKNTAENAIYSAAILRENGINSVFLVTHAWHMPRSVMVFEQQDIKVTPASTVFTSENVEVSAYSYIPSAGALLNTRIALHEYIGMLWYKLRYQ